MLRAINHCIIVQDSVIISERFENDMISYSISYLASATDNICSQVTMIPASMCNGGVCQHVFEVASFCHPSTNITITVLASSKLGPGATSDPITISIIIILIANNS